MCGEKSKIIDLALSDKEMLRLFPDKFKKGKVFIDWYSGNLSIQDGNLLRWDGVFKRIFEKEKTFQFYSGKLNRVKKTSNYIDDPKRINRKFEDKLSNIIFEKIKNKIWYTTAKLDCCSLYTITIGGDGKIKKVIISEYLEYYEAEEIEYCTNTLYNFIKKLKFDIIKINNVAIEENVELRLCIYENGRIENETY